MVSDWTPERLAASRARCEAATPGPWTLYEDEDDLGEFAILGRNTEREFGIAAYLTEADARFMVAARVDLPGALAEIARLRRLLTELVYAGRELHEELLREVNGGMWSESHGAFVAALNAVGCNDLEAGDGNG